MQNAHSHIITVRSVITEHQKILKSTYPKKPILYFAKIVGDVTDS